MTDTNPAVSPVNGGSVSNAQVLQLMEMHTPTTYITEGDIIPQMEITGLLDSAQPILDGTLYAFPFKPNVTCDTGRLTLPLNIGASLGADVVVSIFSDNSGAPGTQIQQLTVPMGFIATSPQSSLAFSEWNGDPTLVLPGSNTLSAYGGYGYSTGIITAVTFNTSPTSASTQGFGISTAVVNPNGSITPWSNQSTYPDQNTAPLLTVVNVGTVLAPVLVVIGIPSLNANEISAFSSITPDGSVYGATMDALGNVGAWSTNSVWPGTLNTTPSQYAEILLGGSISSFDSGVVYVIGGLIDTVDGAAVVSLGSDTYWFQVSSTGLPVAYNQTLSYPFPVAGNSTASGNGLIVSLGGWTGVGNSNFEYPYTFNASTAAADPGTGMIAFNNTSPASVTAIYIDNKTYTGKDISSFLNDTSIVNSLVVGGIVNIYNFSNPGNFASYTISGISQIGYCILTVTYNNSGGTIDTTAGDLVFDFSAAQQVGTLTNWSNAALVNAIATSSLIANDLNAWASLPPMLCPPAYASFLQETNFIGNFVVQFAAQPLTVCGSNVLQFGLEAIYLPPGPSVNATTTPVRARWINCLFQSNTTISNFGDEYLHGFYVQENNLGFLIPMSVKVGIETPSGIKANISEFGSVSIPVWNALTAGTPYWCVVSSPSGRVANNSTIQLVNNQSVITSTYNSFGSASDALSSIDGGVTWQSLTGATGEYVNTTLALFSGTDGKLSHIVEDDGASWSTFWYGAWTRTVAAYGEMIGNTCAVDTYTSEEIL